MSKHYVEESKGRRCDTCISGEVLPSGKIYCNRFCSNYYVDDWCRNHVKREDIADPSTSTVDDNASVSAEESIKEAEGSELVEEYVDDVERSCAGCAYAATVLGSSHLFCNMYGCISDAVIDKCNFWRRSTTTLEPASEDEQCVTISEMKEKINSALQELCAVTLGVGCDEFKCKACGAAYFTFVCPPGNRHYRPNCGSKVDTEET